MFQKWYLSKCIKNNSITLATLFVLGQGSLIHAAPLPKILQEIEKKYTASATLSADFQQEQLNKITSRTTISSGKIFVKRPSKIRWETTKPSSTLLIGNGQKYWFYTPPFDPQDKEEKGQVIEKPAAQVQSKLADALISGSFSMARDMKIQQGTPGTFTLTPKPGSAGTVATASIVVDLKEKLIRKVILNHKGGNRAEISLSNIELGKPLAESLFVFVAPPNTDQIKE